jgi:hypothetical protein
MLLGQYDQAALAFAKALNSAERTDNSDRLLWKKAAASRKAGNSWAAEQSQKAMRERLDRIVLRQQ